MIHLLTLTPYYKYIDSSSSLSKCPSYPKVKAGYPHGFCWSAFPRLPSKQALRTNDINVQVSLTSFGNTIQAYLTTKNTREVYVQSGPETTALSSRLFGTWTIVSAVVRLYAAYNISNPQVYQLAIWAYAIAWVHFMSEWMVFKTAAWGRGLAGPAFISTGSLVWMFSQWGYYVQ